MKGKNTVNAIIGAVVLIFLLSAGMPYKIIETGEVGVITRLGKTTGRVVEPGFNWKTPFIDKVIVYNTRTVKDEAKARAATKDLQDVEVDVVIVYHLDKKKVEELFKTVGKDEDVKAVVIRPLIQETLKQITARFTAEELITKREEVKAQVDESMKKKLESYNISLEEIAITNFEFSIQFANAVEAKQIAEQKSKQAFYELEQAKKEVEKYKLQAVALNEFTLRKMFIEKWDGRLPSTVSDSFLIKTLPESQR